MEGAGAARSFPRLSYHGMLRRVTAGRVGGPFWSILMPQVDRGNREAGPPWTFGGRRLPLVSCGDGWMPTSGGGGCCPPWITLTSSNQAPQHDHADERQVWHPAHLDRRMAPTVESWASYRHHEDSSSWWCGLAMVALASSIASPLSVLILHRAPLYRLFPSETLGDCALPSPNTHFPSTISQRMSQREQGSYLIGAWELVWSQTLFSSVL